LFQGKGKAEPSRKPSAVAAKHLNEGSVQRMPGLIDDILDLGKARLSGGLPVFKRSEPNLASEIG